MDKDGTYGDQITLRAASNIYNVEKDIVSSLGRQGFTTLVPKNSDPNFRITLGHFAEGEGIHYIVLDEDSSNPCQAMLESESLSKDTSINKIDFQLQVPENTIKINENRTMPEDNLILRPNVKEETHN